LSRTVSGETNLLGTLHLGTVLQECLESLPRSARTRRPEGLPVAGPLVRLISNDDGCMSYQDWKCLPPNGSRLSCGRRAGQRIRR